MFPVNQAVRTADLVAMTGDEFNEFQGQTQRKSKRLMPSGTQTFWGKHLRVAGYKGPLNKEGGTAALVMERPAWFSCNPTPQVTGGVDQTNVTHYSYVLAIRRCDGLQLNAHGQGSITEQHMGYRLSATVGFRVRKVK